MLSPLGSIMIHASVICDIDHVNIFDLFRIIDHD